MGIGIGLVYLSIRGIDWPTMKQALATATYSWLALSMVFAFLSHYVRAIRWKMLIEPFAPKPSTRNAFFGVIIGYMANYAPLPRLGEVYRCVILNRYEKTPFTELVGTIVVERALDFLMMGILLTLMLFLRAQQVYNMVMEKGQKYFHDKMMWLGAHVWIIVAALVVMVAGVWFILKTNKNLYNKIKKFVSGFWMGIKGVSKLKNPLLFYFYTVAIWVLYLLTAYTCFFCFQETSHLTLADGLVILIFGAVGVIISPGGTGAYQIIVGRVFLYIYHISGAVAAAQAWLIWGSQFVLVITLGLISLLLLPILNKNDNKV